MKSLNYLFLLLILVSCQADPSVIEDDTIAPPDSTAVLVPVVCDSLPTPNAIFSNAVGELLVFSDSLGDEFDTLTCVLNEAYEDTILLFSAYYCQPHYEAAYSTKWLASPEVYSIIFSQFQSDIFLNHSAQSVAFEDFIAQSHDWQSSVHWYDGYIINGKEYEHVMVFECQSETAPCAFVQSFAFARDRGLVAFYRKEKWWVVL